MCYNGKCMFCLKIETGSLIFAVFNMITAAISCLGVIVWLAIHNINLYNSTHKQPEVNNSIINKIRFLKKFCNITKNCEEDHKYEYMGVDGNIIILVVLTAVVIHFIFSVPLINGLLKKKMSQVKAYFAYGVTKNIILYIIAMIYIPISLIVAIVYTLILGMLYITINRINETAENHSVEDNTISIHVMENMNYSELNLLE